MPSIQIALIRLAACLCLSAGVLFAQQQAPSKPEPGAAKQEQQPQPQEQPKQSEATQPAAPQEQRITGTMDLGYRWVPRLDGSERLYRTLVDFGEGPKLFDANFGLRALQPKWFDRFDVRTTSWGGEPQSTARVDASRYALYEFTLQYRAISYFSNIPSFANPLLPIGYLESQNAADYKRRLFDVDLNLFPKARISPFLAFSRSSRHGPGLEPWIGPANEYLSNTEFDDSTNVFRGGAHVTFSRANFTVEVGGTQFSDELRLFYGPGPNPGNRRTPSLGRTLRLDRADQQYNVDGSMFFTRLSATLRPASFLDIAGQFAFSRPARDFRFTERASGSFVETRRLLGFTGLAANAVGELLRPRPSGNVAVELRPFGALRIVQSFQTNRFHLSSSSLLTETLTGVEGLQGTTSPPTVTSSEPGFSVFTADFNRVQTEAIVQAGRMFTFRGGHRLEWWDGKMPARILSGDELFNRAEQRRNVGLAGMTARVRRSLSLNADAEFSGGDRVFFRTGLFDYQRIKLGGRFQPRTWMSIHGKFTFLQNTNERRDIDLDSRAHDVSLGVLLTPNNGRRLTLALDYAHSVFDSDIAIILPPFFDRDRSPYRFDAHSATAFAGIALLRGARVSLGGSLLVADGTRPTRFYQPRGELFVPVARRVGWFSEWRYYGFRNDNYRFEDFNSHLLSVGLRLTL